MTGQKHPPHETRIYTIAHPLTEEQTAVVFAMTSRSPEPFDKIAQQVSQTRAAEFNERWVLGYGHASVAEHAVVHMAMENISRLAADAVESNRLASYTEKSSRYQVIEANAFHVPAELKQHPILYRQYFQSMTGLFDQYRHSVAALSHHVGQQQPRREDESESAHQMRVRRQVTDSARAVLPAATLTNLGMTANARTMTHAITKLLSDELEEIHALGDTVRERAADIVPTLLKYAMPNEQVRKARSVPPPPPADAAHQRSATLINWDRDAARRVVWGLQYAASRDANSASQEPRQQDEAAAARVVAAELQGRHEHDPLPRALELTRYTAELVVDYGALRELRRHRMLTPISQPLRVIDGFTPVPLFFEAGREDILQAATASAEKLYTMLAGVSAALAQYAVLHAHRQRILIDLNLRELIELLRLRTSLRAHPAIRQPCLELEAAIRRVQPELMNATIGPASLLRE